MSKIICKFCGDELTVGGVWIRSVRTGKAECRNAADKITLHCPKNERP